MPLWPEIGRALAEEFSDLPGPAQLVPLVVRALLSAALGGALGYQRERAGKDAGMRTHMLVCLGTALCVAVPQIGHFSQDSLSRVIQGLLSGVGFLGAGTILKDVRRRQVEGLTTAASIWLTAALGVAVGLGRDGAAIVGAALALALLALVPHARPRGPRQDPSL